jgi:hypothetical protein
MDNKNIAIIIVVVSVSVAGMVGFFCGQVLTTEKRIIAAIQIGQARMAMETATQNMETLKSKITELQNTKVAEDKQSQNTNLFSNNIGSRKGNVNYSLVNTMKKSWQEEGWRYKSKSEQVDCLALMILMVKTDCPDPYDREATLDYIQANIGRW